MLDISRDKEAAKFILSTDLEVFKSQLLNDFNTKLLKDSDENSDVLIEVKTEGYKSTVYKSSMTITTSLSEKEKMYYIVAKYENGLWNIETFEDKNLINFKYTLVKGRKLYFNQNTVFFC